MTAAGAAPELSWAPNCFGWYGTAPLLVQRTEILGINIKPGAGITFDDCWRAMGRVQENVRILLASIDFLPETIVDSLILCCYVKASLQALIPIERHPAHQVRLQVAHASINFRFGHVLAQLAFYRDIDVHGETAIEENIKLALEQLQLWENKVYNAYRYAHQYIQMGEHILQNNLVNIDQDPNYKDQTVGQAHFSYGVLYYYATMSSLVNYTVSQVAHSYKTVAKNSLKSSVTAVNDMRQFVAQHNSQTHKKDRGAKNFFKGVKKIAHKAYTGQTDKDLGFGGGDNSNNAEKPVSDSSLNDSASSFSLNGSSSSIKLMSQSQSSISGSFTASMTSGGTGAPPCKFLKDPAEKHMFVATYHLDQCIYKRKEAGLKYTERTVDALTTLSLLYAWAIKQKNNIQVGMKLDLSVQAVTLQAKNFLQEATETHKKVVEAAAAAGTASNQRTNARIDATLVTLMKRAGMYNAQFIEGEHRLRVGERVTMIREERKRVEALDYVLGTSGVQPQQLLQRIHMALSDESSGRNRHVPGELIEYALSKDDTKGSFETALMTITNQILAGKNGLIAHQDWVAFQRVFLERSFWFSLSRRPQQNGHGPVPIYESLLATARYQLDNRRQMLAHDLAQLEQDRMDRMAKLGVTIGGDLQGLDTLIQKSQAMAERWAVAPEMLDRQDDLPNNKPEYKQKNLSYEMANDFDLKVYLNKLLFTAKIVNLPYHEWIEANFSEFGTIRRGPIKTYKRCLAKAENDYAEKKWPTSAQILDLVRAQLVCETPHQLIQAIERLDAMHHQVKEENKKRVREAANKAARITASYVLIGSLRDRQYSTMRSAVIGESTNVDMTLAEEADARGGLLQVARMKNSFGVEGRDFQDCKFSLAFRVGAGAKAKDMICEFGITLKAYKNHQDRIHELYEIERDKRFFDDVHAKLVEEGDGD